MNHLAPKESELVEKKLGILKVTLEEGKGSKESLIYAYKLKNNGDWQYKRASNGQRLLKRCSLNPKQMAIALGKKYNSQGKKGNVQWAYIQ